MYKRAFFFFLACIAIAVSAQAESISLDAELKAYRAQQSSTPTDVITANGERANGEGEKVLLDGQLIIMSDDRTYSAQGQLVK